MATAFPPAWAWLVDEAVPAHVKARYSPRDSWKDKPFAKEDARFFFRGIEELSELFTDERPRALPPYFRHPKFRSAYLLYFLPLQAAKFLALFRIHEAAAEAALAHGVRVGRLRTADLGAGPATASLAWLLWLLERAAAGVELPPIELDLLDTQPAILEDGRLLIEHLASNFPRLRGRVKVRTHELPWWKAPEALEGDTSLLFLGNVLNEAPPRAEGQGREGDWEKLWGALLDRARGGGALFVEPAARRPSQTLSGLRDRLLETQALPAVPTAIWGPCLHAGACPLAQGRDWCHFSVPAEIPGRWFLEFSKGLGSERQWTKFSYLWLASSDRESDLQAPKPSANLRRVVSDPLGGALKGPRHSADNRGRKIEVLLCEPERPARHVVPGKHPVYRGDVIEL